MIGLMMALLTFFGDGECDFREWVWNSREKLCCITPGEWNDSRVSLKVLDFMYIMFYVHNFYVHNFYVHNFYVHNFMYIMYTDSHGTEIILTTPRKLQQNRYISFIPEPLVFFYKVTLNVNIEFLKIATSEPMVSTEQARPEVLRNSHPKNFQ